MNMNFYKVMSQYYDENKAYDNVASIHNCDKWISYDKFAEGALFCENKMKEIGMTEVERKELKGDGISIYGDRKIPRAWCAKSATLTMSTGEVLCDYKTVPCSLSMYSNPTPSEGIIAELAVIDDIHNVPHDLDLKGKIILVNCGSGGAVEFAKSRGAIGILHDVFPLFPGVRDSREEMKGIHRWDCMPDMGHDLFAFSLTPEQGDMLRNMAKKETVILHAKVDAGFCEGSLYVTSGAIKGTDPTLPEIILYGHLDEPGANDNASGCGGLIEFCRALMKATNAGELPKPKNTIRLVLGPEYNGSVGYIHYYPKRERLCLLSADMIGNEDKDRTFITMYLDPLSNRSYADGAMVLANRRCDEFYGKKRHYLTKPYWAGSDNFVSDPSLMTPSVFFGNYPAQSYHTSSDTMDRIEPDILKRNSIIVGDAAYMLATADTDICDEIAKILTEQGNELISNALTERRKAVCTESYARSINSLKRLVPDYDGYVEYKEYTVEMPEYAKKMGADMIPVRIIKGPLGLPNNPEIREYYSETAIQWTDGKRNIWNITVHACAELQKDSDDEIKEMLKKNIEIFRKLEETGYCSFLG